MNYINNFTTWYMMNEAASSDQINKINRAKSDIKSDVIEGLRKYLNARVKVGSGPQGTIASTFINIDKLKGQAIEAITPQLDLLIKSYIECDGGKSFRKGSENFIISLKKLLISDIDGLSWITKGSIGIAIKSAKKLIGGDPSVAVENIIKGIVNTVYGTVIRMPIFIQNSITNRKLFPFQQEEYKDPGTGKTVPAGIAYKGSFCEDSTSIKGDNFSIDYKVLANKHVQEIVDKVMSL